MRKKQEVLKDNEVITPLVVYHGLALDAAEGECGRQPQPRVLPRALPAPHKPHQASSFLIQQWVQGEAEQKTHLNTTMNLLLICIIFKGVSKTFPNPLDVVPDFFH